MPRNESATSTVRESRIEREVERERNEHMMNQNAKAHLEEDERHKDARETTHSSQVRR